jgi:hypothetical protein
MIASKFAALSALGLAVFPCGCDGHYETIPHLHLLCGGVLFLILGFFCLVFYRRARAKGHREANRRAIIYLLCGCTFLVSTLTLVVDEFANHFLTAKIPRLVFYCEAAGLIAFGISWLTSSLTLPGVTNEHERFPLSKSPPLDDLAWLRLR